MSANLVPREFTTVCPACGAPGRAEFLRHVDIVQCISCDMLYVSPRPTDAAIAEFYSAVGRYDHWEREPGRAQMWRRRLNRISRLATGGRLLDVGTGQGDFGAVASCCFAFEGTEVSSEGARLARERHGLLVHEGDLLSLDLPPAAYDVITLWHVLEHVANPRAVTERCRELLRSGGHLVIAVPNADEDWRLSRRKWDAALQFALGRPPRDKFRVPAVDQCLYLLTGRMPAREVHIPRLLLEAPEEEIHLTHFTLGTLSSMLERAGLHIAERGIDDHSPAEGFRARLRFHREATTFRFTGRAAASAIFVAAREVP